MSVLLMQKGSMSGTLVLHPKTTAPSRDHRQLRPALFARDLLIPAPEFADRRRWDDVDLLFAQLRLAPLDLGLERPALLQQTRKDLVLRHVRDLFALNVDDPAAIAGE